MASVSSGSGDGHQGEASMEAEARETSRLAAKAANMSRRAAVAAERSRRAVDAADWSGRTAEAEEMSRVTPMMRLYLPHVEARLRGVLGWFLGGFCCTHKWTLRIPG